MTWVPLAAVSPHSGRPGCGLELARGYYGMFVMEIARVVTSELHYFFLFSYSIRVLDYDYTTGCEERFTAGIDTSFSGEMTGD